MNKRQKQRVEKLVAALRSGDYKQGTTQLGYIDPSGVQRNCCLGVANEVAGIKPEVIESSLYYDDEISVLTHRLVQYYGFDDTDPNLDDGSEATYSASVWNDKKDKSFEEIADMFEYTYLNGPKPKRIQGND